MKRIFTIASVAIILFSCKQEPTVAPVTNLIPTEKSAKIISADNQFGFELFNKVNASLTGPKNTMVSPMSVSLALAMLYNGTGGNTKKQMEEMLHKNNMTAGDINTSYKELVSALESHDPKVELSISNAIFYRNTFSVKNDFISTNQNYFDAEVSGLDFSKTTETLQEVNGWVNTKTKGKITKILEKINPEDIMYLLNAIYFNGEWKYRFDSKETTKLPFKKEDNTSIQVSTMTIENSFNVYTDQTFQMLEMPYGSGKFSMLILLPASGKTTDDVIPMLSSENMNGWISKMTGQNRRVYLPKFEFKFDESLVEILKTLGMTDAFNARIADLSGISDLGGLAVSEVMHKTYIKVDERGTEAAAVTEVTITYTSIGPDNSFRVDHPFVFAIREKDTNAILFIGKVMDPNQN